MGSSLEQVVAQLRSTLRLARRATEALRLAGQIAQDAVDLLRPLGVGSSQEADYREVASEWRAVAIGAIELRVTLERGSTHLDSYLAGLGVSDHAPRRVEPPPPPPESWADGRRAALPPYITSGHYYDEDGHSELVQSGRETDGEHERIAAHLVGLGIVRKGGGTRCRDARGDEGRVAPAG